MRSSLRAAAASAAVALVLSGCSGAQDAAAASVAEHLLAAVAGDDGAAACDLLAPATRAELESSSGKACATAVLEEDLGDGSQASRVEVFDTMAQVVAGRSTMFLSRYDGQWLVVAAACTPVPHAPYDCSIGLP